jgi:hypothetical protein
MFDYLNSFIDVSLSIAPVLVPIAIYFKQAEFQTFQRQRFALEDFKNSDNEEFKVQIHQYIVGRYFLIDDSHPYTLKQLLSEYDLYNRTVDKHIRLVSINKRRFKENTVIRRVEEDIHYMIERILRHIEKLHELKVEDYEYDKIALFMLKALEGLEQCNLGEFHSKRQAQLARFKVICLRFKH